MLQRLLLLYTLILQRGVGWREKGIPVVVYKFRTVSGRPPGARTRSLNLKGLFEFEDIRITVGYVGYFPDETSHTGKVTQSNTTAFVVGQRLTLTRNYSEISIETKGASS